MPKPTPATIKYEVNGKTNTLNFHAVISEDHQSTAQITKFPVQSGFEVSNHSIIQNRKITITGIVTNTLLKGSGMVQYSVTNNSKEMFKVLGSLISSATLCVVESNLGIYNPVVFTNFKNKQQAGSVDSMTFTMVGEEVQVAGQSGRSAPVQLTMSELLPREKQLLPKAFSEANLPYSPLASVKRSSVFLGTDFKILTPDPSGKVVVTTYECVGFNYIEETHKYRVHTSIIDQYISKIGLGAVTSELGELASRANSSGLTGITNCFMDKAEEAIVQAIDGAIDEYVLGPLGEAIDTIFGQAQDLLSVGGSGIGQTLLGFAVDCVSSEIGDAYGYDVDSAEGLIKAIKSDTEKALDQDVKTLKGMGKSTIKNARSNLPDFDISEEFPLIETTITQISSPIQGALESIGEVRGELYELFGR